MRYNEAPKAKKPERRHQIINHP